MQAILPSKPLKEAVQQLTATLGGSGNPLLEMLYLQSAPGELCLSSTNGKISQHIRVKGEVTRDSTLLVPGAPFRSLLHYCVGETTRLVLQENTLHIQSGGFAADLKQSAPHHYPALEWAEGEISLPGHLLAEALETVAYPAKTQITPGLQGVRLEIRPEGMRTVATALDNAYAVHLGMPTVPRPAPYTLASPEAFERHLADEADSRIHSRQVLSALTRSLGLTDPEQTPLHQVHYQLAHYYQLLRARLALWKAVEARLNGPSAI